MRFEERYERERMAKIVATGKLVGAKLAALVSEIEAATGDVRAADDDADLIDQMLEAISEAPHMQKLLCKYGYHETEVFVSAARTVFAVDLKDAENDLRLSERSFMDAHWFDQLEDIEASDRETAGAA